MFKQILNCIRLIWQNTGSAVFLKIMQCVITAVLAPMGVYFTQELVDHIRTEERYLYLGALVLTLLAGVVNFYLDSVVLIRMKKKLYPNITSRVVEKWKVLEYAFLEDKEAADTMKFVKEEPEEKILQLFLVIVDIGTLLLSIIGSVFVFCQVSVWFAVILCGLLAVMVFVYLAAVERMDKLLYEQSEQERKMLYLGEVLNQKSSLQEMKIYQAAGYILQNWKDISTKVLDEKARLLVHSTKYFLISNGIMLLWSGVVVATLVYFVFQKDMTLGIFTALIGSVGSILSMSEKLARAIAELSRKVPIIRQFTAFLKLPERIEPETDIDFPEVSIAFENVYFTYPKTEKPVLNGVSFEILPNQRAALVGENGAGKSTIVKLLCKLYKPDRGVIKINGVDLNEIPSAQLRKLYGIVFQDYARYALSLRENVALGDLNKLYEDADILRAMEQGMAKDVLEALQKGLETNLGKLTEAGIDLSGGQWQRIAISRACISDAPFIILDEPTAALDPIAESEMYAVFSVLLEKKGCIMISHRLASAKMADKIIVLKDGAVIEEGSHEELMAANGSYASMFAMQSSWYTGGEKHASHF